jgi:hypothetical protein
MFVSRQHAVLDLFQRPLEGFVRASLEIANGKVMVMNHGQKVQLSKEKTLKEVS